jgi:hypothetical protein
MRFSDRRRTRRSDVCLELFALSSPDGRVARLAAPRSARRLRDTSASAGCGLRISHNSAPIKSWIHRADSTQKPFERGCKRAMLARLDWGIPPVAHQVGCKVKRYVASLAGPAPARCRFGGTYGGQGKAAGSSDLPAALLSVPTGPSAGLGTSSRPRRRLTIGQAGSR